MKTCLDFTELFSSYLEEGLEIPLKNELDVHLQTCGKCRQEIDSLRELLTDLGEMGNVKAPAGLAGRIQTRLEKKQNWAELLRQFQMPVAAAASVVLILTGSLLYLTARPDKETKMVQQKETSPQDSGRAPSISVMEKDSSPTSAPSVVGQIALTALGEKIVGKEMDQLPPLKMTAQDPAEAIAGLKEWITPIPEAELLQQEDHWVVRLPVANYPLFLDELKKYGTFTAAETPAFEKKFFEVDLYLLPKE